MQNPGMSAGRLKLGEILVNAGILSEDGLQKALDIQKASGERLGFILITRRYISEAQLIQALSKQLSVPWVSLTHLDITGELMEMVPSELVTHFGILPVYIMSKRPGDKILYVAMDDPTNEDVLKKIADSSGLEVKPMIAAPSELASAIRRFYKSKWDMGERLKERIDGLGGEEPPAREPDETEEQQPVELREEIPADADEEAAILLEEESIVEEEAREQEAEVKEAEAQRPAPGREAREERKRPAAGAPSFTFLDGTTISLASSGIGVKKKERDEIEMIKRIEELMGGDRRGPRVSSAITGILGVLLKRGLITRDEIENIMEELEKA